MIEVRHLTREELDAGLAGIRLSPVNEGVLELIVRRPQIDAREVIEEATLDTAEGLLGDNWRTRGSSRTADGSSHPDMQLNIMNARVINLLTQGKERWQLAGDQLFVDMNLSAENVPPKTLLALGSAVIEVTAQPHTGCQKFAARFGLDALKFVSSPLGRELNLRGINARVVHAGVIRVGDVLRKL
jgi:hypothetical protein